MTSESSVNLPSGADALVPQLSRATDSDRRRITHFAHRTLQPHTHVQQVAAGIPVYPGR